MLPVVGSCESDSQIVDGRFPNLNTFVQVTRPDDVFGTHTFDRRQRESPTVSSAENTCCLADLDQVAVGVADVGTDLDSVILRLRKERGALGRPLCVSLVDIRDSHVEKRSRLVRVLGEWSR